MELSKQNTELFTAELEAVIAAAEARAKDELTATEGVLNGFIQWVPDADKSRTITIHEGPWKINVSWKPNKVKA